MTTDQFSKCIIKMILAGFLILFCRNKSYTQIPTLIVPVGHTDDIYSVAISPDSKYVASASRDKSIKLWHVTSGKLVHTFEGHSDQVNSIAFARNGSLLVSGADDNTINVWSVASGKLLKSLNGHNGDVRTVEFSADGMLLASGSRDKTIKVWDTLTWSLVHSFEKGLEIVNTIKFSPAGDRLISGHADGRIRIWDLVKFRMMDTFALNNSAVKSVGFLSDAKKYYAGFADGTIIVWENSSSIKQFSFYTSDESKRVNAVCASPDGTKLVSAHTDDSLRVWRILDKKLLMSFSHKKDVTCVNYSSDGRAIVSGSLDKTVKLWNLELHQLEKAFEGKSGSVVAIDLTKDGTHLIAGSFDRPASLWSLERSRVLAQLSRAGSNSNSVTFSADGRRFAYGSSDGNVRIRSSDFNVKELLIKASVTQIFAVAFSPDGKRLATGGSNREINIWDSATGSLLINFNIDDGHKSRITCLKFSPDGRTVFSSSLDGELKMWDSNTGRVSFSFHKAHLRAINSIAISLDGSAILTGSDDGYVKMWHPNYKNPTSSYLASKERVTVVDFCQGGRFFATGSDDTSIKLWDSLSNEPITTFLGHSRGIYGLSVSDNGQYLYSGSLDNTIKLWKTGHPKEIASLINIDSTDWVITTPSGLFDGSIGALDKMHYVVIDSIDKEDPYKIINLAQLKERYFQPGLLQILLGISDSVGLRQVPRLKSISLPTPFVLSLREHELVINLKAPANELGNVSIFLNGTEIVEDLRNSSIMTSSGSNMKLDLRVFEQRLDTLNEIKVVVWNKDHWISSEPKTLLYKPDYLRQISIAKERGIYPSSHFEKGQPSMPKLRGVVVGTSNIGLRFADKDAEQFYSGLNLAASELLGKENVNLKLFTARDGVNPGYNKLDIVKELQDASSIGLDDVFVLYLSGHGVNYGGQDGDFYYLTAGANVSDIYKFADPAIRDSYSISSGELRQYLSQIRAHKKILILDVCAAGRGVEQILSSKDIPSSQTRALDRLGSRTGFYLLASSSSDAASYETPIYNQGLLTHAILKGMRGEALRSSHEGLFVDVEKLFNYAVDEVNTLASELSVTQRPFYQKGWIPDRLRSSSGNTSASYDIGKVTEVVQRGIVLSERKPLLKVSSFQEQKDLFDTYEISKKLETYFTTMRYGRIQQPFNILSGVDFEGLYLLTGRYEILQDEFFLTCKLIFNSKVVDTFTIRLPIDRIDDVGPTVSGRIVEFLKK